MRQGESKWIGQRGRKWEQKALGDTEGDIRRRGGVSGGWETETGEGKWQWEMGRVKKTMWYQWNRRSKEAWRGWKNKWKNKQRSKQRRMETGFFFCDWPPNNRFFILRGILLLTISPSLQTVWHHCHALCLFFFRKIVFLKDTNRCRDVSFDLSTNKWPHQTKDKLENTQQYCSIPGKCWPELKTYTHTHKK